MKHHLSTHTCVWPVSSWTRPHWSGQIPPGPGHWRELDPNPWVVQSRHRTLLRWRRAARWQWPACDAPRTSWRSSWRWVEDWTGSLVLGVEEREGLVCVTHWVGPLRQATLGSFSQWKRWEIYITPADSLLFKRQEGLLMFHWLLKLQRWKLIVSTENFESMKHSCDKEDSSCFQLFVLLTLSDVTSIAFEATVWCCCLLALH